MYLLSPFTLLISRAVSKSFHLQPVQVLPSSFFSFPGLVLKGWQGGRGVEMGPQTGLMGWGRFDGYFFPF